MSGNFQSEQNAIILANAITDAGNSIQAGLEAVAEALRGLDEVRITGAIDTHEQNGN